jgi:TolA-binding protein
MKTHLIPLALSVILLSLAASVSAQDAPRDPAVDAELSELRQRLVQLEAANAELRQQVERLQKQNDQLRSLLRAQGTEAEQLPAEPTDEPEAAPRTTSALQLVSSVAEQIPEDASLQTYEQTMEQAMVEQLVHGSGKVRFTGRLDDKGIISVKTSAQREKHTYELSFRVLVDRNAIRRHAIGQSLTVSGRITKVAAVRTKKDDQFQHVVTLVIKDSEVEAQPEPEEEPADEAEAPVR